MWYFKKQAHDIGLHEVDWVAEEVAKMDPYDAIRHMDLIENTHNFQVDKNIDTLDNIKELGTPFRIYYSIHPQIYIYPSEIYKQWRYLLFDPLHPRAMENNDYHEKLNTNLSLDTSREAVVKHLHQKYPTALIECFDSEEEMLSQE